MDLATCLNEGVYSGALTRGKRYPILERDKDKGLIKVRGDNSRVRWFPRYCFDLTGGMVPSIVHIDLSDLAEESLAYSVEVVIELSDGQRRWCFFATPELLSSLNQAELTSGRLVMYGAPHMIVVSTINRDVVEQALHYIDSQDRLLDSTRPIDGRATGGTDTSKSPSSLSASGKPALNDSA